MYGRQRYDTMTRLQHFLGGSVLEKEKFVMEFSGRPINMFFKFCEKIS